MFGIRLIAIKCKDIYFNCFVIGFAMLITVLGLHIIHVPSITLSPALAQIYSS